MLNEGFYQQIFERPLEELPIEQMTKMYKTPYMIWSNYDIPERRMDISANYFSAVLLDTLELNMTGYQKYLLHLQEKIPIVTDICYLNNDGIVYEYEKESKNEYLLKEYNMLQYYLLFDDWDRKDDFFYLQ